MPDRLPEDATPQDIRSAILAALYDAHFNSRILGANWQELRESLGLTDQKWRPAISYLEQSGLARFRSNVHCEITSAGIDHIESLQPENVRMSDSTPPPDRRKVFVIHGRNLKIRNAMFEFLRKLDLRPLEWSELVASTGQGSPTIHAILDRAFGEATAVVAILTPDDVGQLHPTFHKPDDDETETNPTGQARQNVIFEMGMAFGYSPERTVIVQVGRVRPFSDIGGRHVVKLSNDAQVMKEIAQRLETCGCEVNMRGSDWLSIRNFTMEDLELVNFEFDQPSFEEDVDTELTDDEIDYLLEISKPMNRGTIPIQ